MPEVFSTLILLLVIITKRINCLAIMNYSLIGKGSIPSCFISYNQRVAQLLLFQTVQNEPPLKYREYIQKHVSKLDKVVGSSATHDNWHP